MSHDMSRKITTSQTIGPFPHEGWRWGFDATAQLPAGALVSVSGQVFDGDGAPITDAVLEAWAPAAAQDESALPIPGFRRVAAGDQGEFRFQFASSAKVAGEPLAYVTLFARGVLKHQFTAVFLEDDPALAQSALLYQVDAERRLTLVARKTGPGEYRWDLWMQTDKETVFFDYE